MQIVSSSLVPGHAMHVSLSCSKGLASRRTLKFYLTVDQVSRLLCIDGRCNLLTVRSIQSTEYAHEFHDYC